MNSPFKDASVSIVARSPELDVEAVEIVVTLPTFRRPDHLLRTLASLTAQRTGRRFAIIVMDNDAERREGVEAAQPLFADGRVSGMLIVAHDRGNCSAYNAGWQTALIHFPAFAALMVIDDDECADPDWVERMASASTKHDLDIVGGPQIPIFETGGDSPAARHPVFALPYARTGPVPALYSSGNLFIRRRVLERMGPPFLDTAFNFLGGGDSDFLSRASVAGFRLGWCSEAPVRETVPTRRLEADWIRARSIRNGVISTLVELRKRRDEPLGRPRVFFHSIGLLAASPLRAIVRAASRGVTADALYPVLVAFGRVAAHFGYAHEQYRNPEKN